MLKAIFKVNQNYFSSAILDANLNTILDGFAGDPLHVDHK